MRTKMVKWGLRAGLVIVALLIVLGASCLIPASVGDGGAAQAQEFEPYAHGGAIEENAQAPSSDALSEIYGGKKPIDSGKPLDPNRVLAILQTPASFSFFMFGGSSLVSDTFNGRIATIRDIFLPLGYCIMFVCWIIGMCKSGMSLNFDPGAKDGILRSGLTLMLGLFLMEVSMEIMESLSALCWEYCTSLYVDGGTWTYFSQIKNEIVNDGIADTLWVFDDLLECLKECALDIMALIIKAVLLLNVAYMGLLQCFSPIFIGFAAGGEGTRRFATSFFKEYLKVCLVPPLVIVYVTLCFELFAKSGVGVLLCLVLALSAFSVKNKLDKIIA